MFDRTGSSWVFAAELAGTGADAGDRFGRGVDIDGDTIIAGCPYFAAGCGGTDLCGSVFVFERDGGVWAEVDRLTPADQANEDYFGYEVSLDGDRLVATSVFDDDMGWQSGSGYLFEWVDGQWTERFKFVPSDGCEQDMTGRACEVQGDGSLCEDVTCEADCAADVNSDGGVGVDDLLEVIGAWGPCP